MQRLKYLFFHLSPFCCIIIAAHPKTEAREQRPFFTTSSQQQHHQRRTLQIHLPPAPVTPFRGGLSAVRNNQNKDDVDNSKGDDDESVIVVEAGSSDHNNHQSSSSSSSYHGHNVKSFSSSWTPEDFPDPWTNPLLCGGAATASLLAKKMDQQQQQQRRQGVINVDSTLEQQQQQQQQQQQVHTTMKMPLFCDPDQVLDKQTLRTVMIKLREFSQEFASKNFVEGGDFGFWEEMDGDDNNNYNNDEEEEQRQQQRSDDNDGVNSSSEDVQNGDNDENDNGPKATMHHQIRRRRLRHYTSNRGNNIHRQLASSSNNNNNNSRLSDTDAVEVAIALVEKINLPAILRADSYFFYSDQDDMVNDAAQYFARYVHDTWNKRLMQEQKDGSVSTNIVLIFISVHDRICYISSGTRIATILPWWRLEHVVQDMKPMLRKGRTGDALVVAVDDMTTLIRAGSPTVKDRMSDFLSRFGVVLAFAFFTFLFATYGEFQDRRKRVFLAERRSRMNAAEREKARTLQKEFQSSSCPICLEPFGSSSGNDKGDLSVDDDDASTKGCVPKREQQQKMKRVDSLGIPLNGNDEKPIKFLRCGHIFDETCWKMWVDSGHGNVMMCPVCRQDVGRGKRGNRHHGTASNTTTTSMNNGGNSGQHSLFLRIMEHAHAATAPATLLRPINNLHTNYSSTSRSLTRPDYEERMNDSSATSLYSTETTPLI